MNEAVHTIGGYWGNHVEWLDYEQRKVWGHMPARPAVGDFLDSKMQSGRTVRFRFKSVDLQHDPSDMFFGVVQEIGFVMPDGSISTEGMQRISWWNRLINRFFATVDREQSP